MGNSNLFRANGGILLSRGDSTHSWDFGWRDNPPAVKAVLATLPYPRFEVAAAHLNGSGEGKTVLLSDAVKRVLGKHMPAQQQPRGTCVSRGWSRATDYLECVEIALGGEPEEFKYISHSYVYGRCREIGGDLSSQDGAVGAWAAKAVAEGVLTNEDCQDKDVGYDDLAVQWGSRGVPKKLKDLALERGNKVKTVTLVTTAEQARDMLCNGYPLSVCSGQGFAMSRDSEGYCHTQGEWAHCMMWSAYRDDKKRFLVEQSWGQNTPDGPLGNLDIPDNAFWIDWDVADHMLKGEDSFALSAFQGFPARRLDWII